MTELEIAVELRNGYARWLAGAKMDEGSRGCPAMASTFEGE